MEFDIRNKENHIPTVIRFADSQNAEEYGQADIIKRNAGEVQIFESNNSDYVRLCSKQHALHLIEALQLAIEKNWFIN